jgi:hypothetical protein
MRIQIRNFNIVVNIVKHTKNRKISFPSNFPLPSRLILICHNEKGFSKANFTSCKAYLVESQIITLVELSFLGGKFRNFREGKLKIFGNCQVIRWVNYDLKTEKFLHVILRK